MHDLQGVSRDGGETRLLAHEPRENPGTAFGGLVEEETLADVTRGHRLGKHLAFFELEHRLDATQDRMLQGGQRDLRRFVGGLEEERVLPILNAGDNQLPSRRRGVECVLVRVVVLVPGPVSGNRIDAKAEDLLVGSPSQTLVEARDRCAGTVRHTHYLAVLVGGRRNPYIDLPVADRPFERRLQVEALALAFFVVRRDLLGRLRGHVLDPKRAAHDLGVTERRSAGVAHGQVVAQVARTAGRADSHGLRGQLRVGRRRLPVSEREECSHHPVGPPLVVDEAAGAELGKREEARALQVGLPPTTVPARRDVREEGQPGEVVPGQEAFRGEVAVRVEVARQRTRAALEQVELVHRLRVPGLRRPLLPVGGGVVVHGPPCGVALLLGGGKKVSPAIERRVEARCRRRHEAIGIRVAACVPRCQIGREIVCDRIEDAPNPCTCVVSDALVPDRGLKLRGKGTAGVVENQQLRDALVERSVDAREPDRLEVAVDQVPVRELENRRPHLAVDHRLRVAEEVLVVRALGRRIRDHQGGLSAAARAPAALRVVRRRGRHVAHVDRVERRDVDAELHRRGAKQDRQEPIGLSNLSEMLLVVRELPALSISEAKALLPDLPVVGIDLGGVLARLEPEERVGRGAEHRGEVLVEVAEERVPSGIAAVFWFIARLEDDTGIVEAPAGLVERGVLLRHEAVRRRRTKEVVDEPVEVLRAQVSDDRVVAPEPRRAQRSPQTAA